MHPLAFLALLSAFAREPAPRVPEGFAIVRQTPELLVLADASGAELRLPRSRIRELGRSPLSLMPEGLERALSKEELRALLAFLRSLR